jgi:NADH:ubiquinone oxidoreductase subunit F (NADH-binding)
MADEHGWVGETIETGFFGSEGGDGAGALDPAVVDLVDQLLANAPPGREGLIRVLVGLQRTFDRVSKRVQELVADRLGMSPAQIAGVVSYYPALSTERRADAKAGAGARVDGPSLGEEALLDHALGKVPAEVIDAPGERIDIIRRGSVLERCGIVDPDDMDHALALGAYEGLRRAVFEIEPAGVMELVKRSALRESVGGGFPVGLKWAVAAETPGDVRYVVGNGEGGSPALLVDRALLEGDPHGVIEGMAIAGYAVGAREGRLFLQSDHSLAVARARRAVDQARRRGCLGSAVFGTSFGFDIEVAENAGASMGGEETALLNALQGRRGVARPRPPYPVTSGLWGRPTVIHGLETLRNIPLIVLAGFGSRDEMKAGARVVSVSGDVFTPGLAEVPLGTTIDEIVDEIAGGCNDGEIVAVHVGGLGGATLGPDQLGTAVDFGSLSETGAHLGSGEIVVLGRGSCPVALARTLIAFAAAESCGTCPPCRIGTGVLLELLDLIGSGSAGGEDLDRLERLCRHVRRTSMCELGRRAPSSVITGLSNIRNVYEAHLSGRGCPSGACWPPRE